MRTVKSTPVRGTTARGGEPIEQPRATPIHITPPPIEVTGTHGVAPVMIASLPPMASGSDAYLRQFYRSPRLPSRRYLPIRSQ